MVEQIFEQANKVLVVDKYDDVYETHSVKIPSFLSRKNDLFTYDEQRDVACSHVIRELAMKKGNLNDPK